MLVIIIPKRAAIALEPDLKNHPELVVREDTRKLVFGGHAHDVKRLIAWCNSRLSGAEDKGTRAALRKTRDRSRVLLLLGGET